MMLRTMPAALALMLAGCAAGGTAGSAAFSDHLCDNGAELHVAWWAGKAEVAYGKQHWTLPLAMSGSGARYSDGVREVWEHQGIVRVDDGASPPTSCKERGP